MSNMLADRYKIIKEFKTGGFSQTFLARDIEHPKRQRCVIKRLQPHDSDAFTVKAARQLFHNEVNVLKRLGHHTQIPQLQTTFTVGEDFYLVEEFIEGHGLAREFHWGWHWSEAKVIALLKDILEPLAFVHRLRIIHRDIKPENLIRRQQDQRIVLIDFGSVQNHQVSPAAVVGTHGYMPPEQLNGHPKYSSDLYAVGMIALQALTGINPAKQALATDRETGNIQWRRYRSLSPRLAEVLNAMTCRDVRQRYRSADKALNAVNSQIETEKTSIPNRRRFLQAAG